MFQGNRLQTLRLQYEYTIQALADTLGVDVEQIWRWERGINEPNSVNIAQIALLFGVSADYLLGLTDLPVYPILELSESEQRLVDAHIAQGI